MKHPALLFLLFSLLAFTTQISYAKTDRNVFNVTTEEQVYAIGHPIDVIFETQNHTHSLSTISLEILEKDFVIHDYNIDKYEDDSNDKLIRIENLIVRLYPRRAGILNIPAFQLGKYNSRAISLNIVNDFNSTIQIRTTTTKKTYFQREPIHIYVDIYYRRKKITSHIGDLINKNFIISEVVKTEYTVTRDNATTIVDRFSWIVFPLIEGQQTLSLPMIKTGGRRMYPSGQLKLNVTALPSTLPISVPVSKQVITSDIMLAEQFWINKVYFWTLTVIGNGLNENTLEKILAPQLQSDSEIRYFPRIYHQTRIENGTKFKLEIKIPFKLYQSGSFQFPTLNIPYIDTNTGIIEHAYSTDLKITATSSAIENFKVILIICLFLAILLIPILKTLKHLYIKHQYMKCYKSILVTNNPKRLKKFIFNLTPNFNIDTGLTLKTWQQTAAINNPEQRKILLKISDLLNNFNYGVHHTDNEIALLKRLIKTLT